MVFNEEIASEVAKVLLQIKAIKLQPSNPFTWASGIQSPIYCDNRKILSYPFARNLVSDKLAEVVSQKYPKPDVLAGVATGGIAHGVLAAQRLDYPFVYIRSNSKGHGLQNMIEGELEKGSNVVVIEDLVSTGGSSLKAVDALRDYGCNVIGMVAIFSYGFKIAEDNFKAAKCDLVTLSDYSSLIKEALLSGYISKSEINVLEDWRKNPAKLKAL
jgi:orotate phosphoribosyltransferase